MTININIGSNTPKPTEEKSSKKVDLKIQARKSLDGNVLISDHIDVDITYSPKDGKITIFPKDMFNETVYGAQNRFFDFFVKKGICSPESVQSSNVYGAMEADLLESDSAINVDDVVMLNISSFLEEERPYFMYDKAYKEQEIDMYTDPDSEDTTELGEVPHEEKKGDQVDLYRSGRYIKGYF